MFHRFCELAHWKTFAMIWLHWFGRHHTDANVILLCASTSLKHQNFLQSLSKPIRSESKRPPLVSDRDHILAWQFYYYIIFKGGSPEYSLYTPLANGKVTLIYRSTLQKTLGDWKFWEVVRCLNIQGNRYIEGRYKQVWLYDKVKRNKINDGLGGWWILRTDWLEHWQSNCARH